MKQDDPWNAWLEHCRETGAQQPLTDRIMADIALEPAIARAVPLRRSLWLPIVVWSAAAIVCAVRIYSVISVVAAPVALQEEHHEPQRSEHEHRSPSES